MMNMAGFEESKVPRCSFCGKSEFQVNRLLYGNGAFICDECVSLCYQMLMDDGLVKAAPSNGVSAQFRP